MSMTSRNDTDSLSLSDALRRAEEVFEKWRRQVAPGCFDHYEGLAFVHALREAFQPAPGETPGLPPPDCSWCGRLGRRSNDLRDEILRVIARHFPEGLPAVNGERSSAPSPAPGDTAEVEKMKFYDAPGRCQWHDTVLIEYLPEKPGSYFCFLCEDDRRKGWLITISRGMFHQSPS